MFFILFKFIKYFSFFELQEKALIDHIVPDFSSLFVPE
jgi:hypothetical protein